MYHLIKESHDELPVILMSDLSLTFLKSWLDKTYEGWERKEHGDGSLTFLKHPTEEDKWGSTTFIRAVWAEPVDLRKES